MRFLLSFKLLIMAAFLMSPPAFALDGHLASYQFDGNAAEEYVRYPAGVDNGATLTNDRFGQANSAYLFNGIDNSIQISSVPARFSGDFSLSFWVKSTSSTTTRMHAASLGTVPADNLDFDFDGGYGLWVYWNGGGGNCITTGRPGEFTDGSWHQILLQRTGAEVQLYVDGILKGTKIYTGAIGSSSVINLGRSSSGSYWWGGAIDDLLIFNRALSASEIQSSVSDGLLASYRFSGNASEENNRYPAGVVNGAVLTNDRIGQANSAYLFNGANSSIQISSVPAQFTGDFAISFWAKGTSPTTTRVHALSLGTVPADNLDFDFDGGYGLWVYWNGGGGNCITTGRPGEFTDGSWHQILLQRTGAEVQLYVDGILKGTKIYTGAIGSSSIINLGRSSSGSFWWGGAIDDLRIYNRAMSASEIQSSLTVASYRFSGNTAEENGRYPAGVVNGAVLTNDRYGQAGSAYLFNGRSDTIQISSVPARFTGDFAVSFWAKSTSPTTTRMHALSLGAAPADNLDFNFDGGFGLWVFWNGGGGNGITAGQPGDFTDGSWHQILLQRAGTEVQLYVDGILKGTKAYTGAIGSSSLINLGRSSSGNFWWNGALNDLRIYNRALSAGEIESNVDLVRLNPGAHGIIRGPSSVAIGDKPTYAIIPDTGYRIDDVTVDGTSVGAVASYTFPAGITSGVTIAARFSLLGISEGLLASYRFSGNASEENGRYPAGVVNGAILTNDRFGQAASAYFFDGTSDSIQISSVPAQFTGDFALSFWVKSASPPTRTHALSLGTVPADNLDFDFNGGYGLWVYWNGAGGNGITAGRPGEFTDGSWHQVLLQRTGTEVQLYLDGILRGTRIYTGAIGSASGINLGKSSSGSYWWDGAVDDLRIYSRALAPDQVMNLMYSWTRVKPATTSYGLVVSYFFSGNANNDNGNGFNGITHNVTPTKDRYGTDNRAYAFDGASSFIDTAEGLGSFKSDFAIAFWVNSSSTNHMNAFSMGNFGSDSLDFAFNDQAGLKVAWDSGNSSLLAGRPGEFTDGGWHHIALQRAGDSVQLYVDGILKASTVDTGPFGSNTVMRIGRSSATSGTGYYYWHGAIDDVLIYARSFTAEELVDLQQLQFQPSDGAGALNFKGNMWLIGGWNPNTTPITNSQMWYSADGSVWKLSTNAPWEGRHTAGYVVFNNKIWIIGGDKVTGHYQNDVWCSDDGVNWQFVTDNVPWADRATHYTLAFNNKIWLMGGQQIGNSTGMVAYNDVYSSPDGINWTQVTAHAGWSPRGLILGNVVFQGKMWVIGGGTYDVRSLNNDVWSSVDGNNWELVLQNAPWAPRQYHSTAVFDNKMWVLAGDENNPATPGAATDVWFTADGKTWHQLPNTPWIGRHAATVVVFNNALWLIAGSGAQAYNDVWKLTYSP